MPDYFVIETTGGRGLYDGTPNHIKDVVDETEAISVVVAGSPFAPQRTFIVFDVASGVARTTEDSKTTVILDPTDPTDVKELAELDEQAALDLQAERAAKEEAARIEAETGSVEVDVTNVN